MIYKLYGTNLGLDKTATADYLAFETTSTKKLIKYINSHAVVPCALAPITAKQLEKRGRARVTIKNSGYRLKENITEVYNWIRLDVDMPGEEKKIDKALKGVEHFKKPSSSNATNPYKWHYFIPIKNVAKDYDRYKQQYFKFLNEFGVTCLHDKKFQFLVQNTNPYRGKLKDAIAKTTHVKGQIWKAPKVEKISSKRKKYADNADGDLSDVKMHRQPKVLKIKILAMTKKRDYILLDPDNLIETDLGWAKMVDIGRRIPDGGKINRLGCPVYNHGSDNVPGYCIANREGVNVYFNCQGSRCEGKTYKIILQDLFKIRKKNET